MWLLYSQETIAPFYIDRVGCYPFLSLYVSIVFLDVFGVKNWQYG
jgi:hypothetical protein